MKIQVNTPNLKVFESSLYRTTTTLFSNQDLCLLVDPNWLPQEIHHIKEYVDNASRNRRLHILFTHSDYDHIIAFRAFDNAEVIASAAFQENPAKNKSVQDILDFDDKNYIERPYPIEYPEVNQVIKEDGQQLHFGETQLTFYHAGGHTNDGLFTLIEPYGIWIAGDYLSNVEFPFIYDSSSAYLKTIERTEMILASHHISRLIPGHGDMTENTDEIQQRISDSKNYIAELRESIKNKTEFDTAKWMSKYPFPKFIEKAHLDNIELIKKEMGINT